MSDSVTPGELRPKQAKALECLIARGASDTLVAVSKKANVTVRTLYRYLRDPAFSSEFRRRIEDELGAARGEVAKALVAGAVVAGPGQAAMQRIYWTRLGELSDKQEHTGPGGGPVITRIERVIVDPKQSVS